MKALTIQTGKHPWQGREPGMGEPSKVTTQNPHEGSNRIGVRRELRNCILRIRFLDIIPSPLLPGSFFLGEILFYLVPVLQSSSFPKCDQHHNDPCTLALQWDQPNFCSGQLLKYFWVCSISGLNTLHSINQTVRYTSGHLVLHHNIIS